MRACVSPECSPATHDDDDDEDDGDEGDDDQLVRSLGSMIVS